VAESSTSARSATTTGAPAHADLFKFLQKLINDMYEDLELPGFPAIVARLHRTLADERSSSKDVVRLISSEPALSARLLHLANSATFNPSARQVSDLKSAVNMLGFSLVRATATTFAMRQLDQQEWLKPLQIHLTRVWKDSTGVAAICYVGARNTDGMRPDEALAAGLFHQLGALYVLTRAHKEGIGLAASADWVETISAWHPTIARAILENWGMPAELAGAVESQDALGDGNPAELALLPRMLAAAKLYHLVLKDPESAAMASEKLGNVRFGTRPFLDLMAPLRNDIDAVSRTIGQA
jgi:HD-like signal output (HDOD) protein